MQFTLHFRRRSRDKDRKRYGMLACQHSAKLVQLKDFFFYWQFHLFLECV